MLPLGEFLVETPEHLHDTQRGGGHGVGEVTTGRGHGAHDGHGTWINKTASKHIPTTSGVRVGSASSYGRMRTPALAI